MGKANLGFWVAAANGYPKGRSLIGCRDAGLLRVRLQLEGTQGLVDQGSFGPCSSLGDGEYHLRLPSSSSPVGVAAPLAWPPVASAADAVSLASSNGNAICNTCLPTGSLWLPLPVFGPHLLISAFSTCELLSGYGPFAVCCQTSRLRTHARRASSDGMAPLSRSFIATMSHSDSLPRRHLQLASGSLSLRLPAGTSTSLLSSTRSPLVTHASFHIVPAATYLSDCHAGLRQSVASSPIQVGRFAVRAYQALQPNVTLTSLSPGPHSLQASF